MPRGNPSSKESSNGTVGFVAPGKDRSPKLPRPGPLEAGVANHCRAGCVLEQSARGICRGRLPLCIRSLIAWSFLTQAAGGLVARLEFLDKPGFPLELPFDQHATPYSCGADAVRPGV